MVSWWMQEMITCTECGEIRAKWLATYHLNSGFVCRTCTNKQGTDVTHPLTSEVADAH